MVIWMNNDILIAKGKKGDDENIERKLFRTTGHQQQQLFTNYCLILGLATNVFYM